MDTDFDDTVNRHFDALELDYNCSLKWEDIRLKYHRLVMQYHPDKFNDKLNLDLRLHYIQRFTEITEAYQFLSNLKNQRLQVDDLSNCLQKFTL